MHLLVFWCSLQLTVQFCRTCSSKQARKDRTSKWMYVCAVVFLSTEEVWFDPIACGRCELRFELARIVGIMIYEFHLVGYNSVALVNSCLFVQFFSCLKKSFYLIKWRWKGKFTCRPHGWFVETCSLPLNISSSYLGQPETMWKCAFRIRSEYNSECWSCTWWVFCLTARFSH